jgi:hypothetical protein
VGALSSLHLYLPLWRRAEGAQKRSVTTSDNLLPGQFILRRLLHGHITFTGARKKS